MPTTREEHVIYTRNELNSYQYYIDVIEYLRNVGIKSYLDIGANIGEFCNVLFEKIPTLQEAHLIECESENIKFLKNNIKPPNVAVYDLAVGYDITNPTLITNGNVGGFKVVESDTVGNFNVKVSTLEDLNLPIVDFVKIDIEGGEYSIIENSKYIQKIKYIEIEFHDHENISTVEYVSDKFKDHQLKFLEPVLEGRCLLVKT
jgi:FkbM family methyltransferase